MHVTRKVIAAVALAAIALPRAQQPTDTAHYVVLVDGDPRTNISDVRKTVMDVEDGVRFDPRELYAAVGVRP
jgi:hypothetical protein